EKAARPAGESDADRPPFTPYPLDVPYDVPVMVTHDPKTCTACNQTITLASPEAAAKAGIKTVRVEYDWITVTIEAHGEVVQDPAAVGRVAPRVAGTLVALDKRPGDPVRRGELVALVSAPEVGRVKAAYLTAKVHRENKQQILRTLEEGGAPQASVVPA